MARRMRKQEKVSALRKELIENDEIFKKNKDKYRIQVQTGLIRKGLPQQSPMYDRLLKQMNYDIDETKIKIDSGMKIINPVFEYEKNPKYFALQVARLKHHLSELKENVAEITSKVEEVEKDIVNQNARIKERRIQILEELTKLGEDVTELKDTPQTYIG